MPLSLSWVFPVVSVFISTSLLFAFGVPSEVFEYHHDREDSGLVLKRLTRGTIDEDGTGSESSPIEELVGILHFDVSARSRHSPRLPRGESRPHQGPELRRSTGLRVRQSRGEVEKVAECPICLELMNPRSRTALDCGHELHRNCAIKWANKVSQAILSSL